MKKRNGSAGLVGICGAALLLAGCGGGSGQKAATLPSKSTSTSASGPATASASTSNAAATSATTPSAAATSSSNVPAAVLPPDFKIVVDAQTPTDPTQQAIWSGWLSFYQAEYQAVGRSNAGDPLYKLWTGSADNGTPSAQDSTGKFIQYFQSAGLTVTGTLRLYQRAIIGTDSEGTHLSWCEDQTAAYAKDVKTGVVKKTQPGRNDFDYYESYEKQGADGRWITIWIYGVKGDDRCK